MNLDGSRVLVTGAGGFIGKHVVALLQSHGADVLSSRGTPSRRADFGIEGRVRALVEEARPRAVVNLAAMSRADACEREPKAAQRINGLAVIELASACEASGSHLVHISTDQVFDGLAESYADDAIPNPIHAYGRSKATAETALRERHPATCILRPTLVFGHSEDGQTGATDGILSAARAGREIALFTDEYRRPVSADFVAETVAAALRSEITGCINICGADLVSRFDLGCLICQVADIDSSFIRPSRLSDWTGPPRPPRLALESTRLRDDLAKNPPPLAGALSGLLHAEN